VSRVSHFSEHIGAIGSVVTGVVQDLLAAQREDSDRHMQLMMAQREDGERRQEVQMRMMLAHRQETELRVQEARQSAEGQMELMREMHEMAGRHAQQEAQCREKELEKTVRQEMEERQVKLISGETERARRQRLVQRELERKRSTRVSFPLGTGGKSPLSSRASNPSTPKAFEYHSERENDANVNPAKTGVTQLDNCDTYLVQPGGNMPSVPPGYVLVSIGPSSTLGYAHSTPVGVGVASTIAPDVGPVRPSLGTTVGLELGSTSASAPSQNTAPTSDDLGTVVNANVASSTAATTDTKVGPAIAFSSVTNVGSALVTSGSAANVGTPVTIPGFAANVNPTVIVSDSAANVGPATTSGTTVAASSLATTVGVSGTIFSSAVNAGATIVTTTSSAAPIPPTVIPAAAVGTVPVAPTVVVKQLQPVRPYNGSTPWKTFREQYRRVARVNGWVTTTDLVQYLTLPAAEVLKDFDDSTETAYEDLWKRIEHRFGEVDESREAQRKFGNRRQTESKSLQEYEQALRTLYKQGWASVTTEIRDAALKRRFEDGVASPELSQYLRLHHRKSNFGETAEQARLYTATVEGAKTKKAVRFLAEAEEDEEGQSAILNHLRVLEKKLDQMERDRSRPRSPSH